MRDTRGNAVGAIETLQDITERKRAEEAAQEERDMAQKYLDVAGVMLVVIDADQSVSLINQRGCEILGYEEGEIVGKSWFDTCIPQRQRDEIRGVFDHLMAGEIEPVEYYENPIVTKSGEERIIAWHNTVLTDDTGKAIGTLRSGEDITERLRLESQLRQASKMEAVGQLAGGVAHDFNNLLTVINGYSEFVADELDEDDPMRRDVAEVRQAGQRAAVLTRQLLAFSRREVLELHVLNLNDVLQGTTKMLGRLIGEDIKLEIKLAGDLGNIRSDPGQIEQVVTNLVINARDAMPKGGALTIETANAALDRADVLFPMGAAPGPYVSLTVRDTGHGMTPEIIERIFEPFFTTKEAGHGTGLGLATVYGIVEQSGGAIDVRSQPGQGSTFAIYFPRVDQAVEIESAKSPDALPVGTETILVVEDDANIRELAGRVLRDWGYTVIEASNGAEVLALCQESRGAIDLVLTDVVMPEMDGPDLVERLRHLYPDVKVLYMSGYAGRILSDRGDLDAPLIREPLELSSLAREVRQVLEA